MSVSVNPGDPRPLYAQVRETLLDRIKSGHWRPGQLLPNEFDIAAEFKVSQGTARKAIDTLAADGLVVRRQGKGTYVVEHTPADMLFRFFQIYSDDGRPIKPDAPHGGRPTRGSATAEEAAALDIEPDVDVIRIERVRFNGTVPLVHEAIVLPAAQFPGLADQPTVPNTLYDLFQRQYGRMVARADERIVPVLGSGPIARALGIVEGTSLLRVERIAYGLDDQRLEWRVSLCHLQGGHYFVRLK